MAEHPMAPSSVVRFRYRPAEGKRLRSQRAEIVAEMPGLLLLRPVDQHGEDQSFEQADGTIVDRQWLLSTELVVDRVPQRRNLHYDVLEDDR